MCLLMLFWYSKTHFHQLGSFKLIKTMLKSLNVCKVYLQCGIVIQRVVTKHGLLAFNYRDDEFKDRICKE